MRTWRNRVMGVVAAFGVAALAPSAVGLDLLGAQIGGGGGATNTTFTTGTLWATSEARVDLPDAAAPECEFPGSPPVLVAEESTALEPTVEVVTTFGPATIGIGDNLATPFEVAAGTMNLNTVTTYETLVTQYFQATAAGEVCAVVAAARFTG
jgi:hypothetical protein